MLLEQIRSELETAEELPAEALAEAVTHADALVPEIVAVLRKAADGVHLLPRQQNLLFFGLHVLAAAGRTELCQPFLALLHRPEWQLEQLLGDGITKNATGFLLSFYDGNAEPFMAAIADRRVAPSVRWSLFQVLARLCWEGRIPRERLVALIDRFDREQLADPEDLSWIGWEDAIRLLGLKEFETSVRQGWESGRVSFRNQADRDEWLSQLSWSAANPRDPQPFIDDQVVPVIDPVESLGWLARRIERSRAEEAEEEPEEEEEAPDPAEAVRLDESELRWLEGFLVSDHVGPGTLTLEELDGFLVALAAGPVRVPPSEYMKVVWGEGGEPRYDSAEQAELVEDLLSRHRDTISMRLDAMFPLDLQIFEAPIEEKGRGWVEGFLMGMDLRRKEWEPILRHKDAGAFVWTIMALIADDYEPEAEPITPDERAASLAMLRLNVLGIATFWRNPELLRRTPARSEKIGRNEPCPCGSGRKYKKCCGAAA